MNTAVEKTAGWSLLAGCLLMLSTMALHPEGGSLQHLLKVSRMVVVSHSMALLAIPLLGIGFWGWTRIMGINRFLPQLSFALMLTGLSAGMMAAVINGLALPLFIQNFQQISAEDIGSLRPILRSSRTLNQAFDYVFLTAVSLSILMGSIGIVVFRKLPGWIGYAGLLISITALTLLMSGFVLVNLHGFRLFVFSSIVWIGLVAIALIRTKAGRDR